MVVANVYPKWKQTAVNEEKREQPQVIEGEFKPSNRMAVIR
jgi:hypothetical protein